MVDLALLQSISYMAGALGVCIAAIFYVLNLRISQRNMKQTLETRQVQLYMLLYQQLNRKETIRDSIELLNMGWKDYSDFERKYGSDNNPENYALRHSFWYLLDGLGYLVRENLVTPKMMYQLVGQEVPWHWKKYSDIIAELRVRTKLANMYEGFEYLAGVMSKIQLELDPTWEIPDTYTKYAGDKSVAP